MKKVFDTVTVKTEKRPNLIFRKAKMVGKSVEKYAAKKIAVPELQGEPLFGFHPILEALRANKRDFHQLFIKRTIEKRAENDPRIAEILKLSEERGIRKELLSDDKMDRLTEFQLHNGICMDVTRLEFSDYEPITRSIFVDKVLDPGNLGAIGRSALYFGADGISFAKGRGPKFITPSMSKSSCGALEHLPIQQVTDFYEFRDNVKSNGGVLIATCDPTAAQRLGLNTKRLDQWKPSPNVAIVLGDEGIGVGERILNMCDEVITIEGMRKNETNVTSINVSVVSGILLHHISNHQKNQI